jgi:hypothetical protein
MLDTAVVERSLPALRSDPSGLPASINVYNLQTLVLNADYSPTWTWPLSLIPATEAITDFYKETVHVVETWKDAFGNELAFRSSSMVIPAPKVIVLNDYVHVHSEAKFNRENVLLRDRFRCQYCGERFTRKALTFDHLIPKSEGGKTEWTNIVMACSPCNTRKANKMPQFSGRKGPRGSGLRPLKMPREPTNMELIKIGMEFLSEDTIRDYGSYLYWHVPLDP